MPRTHEVTVRTLDPLTGLDPQRHPYCGGVAAFAELCRDLPTYVVDFLWNQWVMLDCGSAYGASSREFALIPRYEQTSAGEEQQRVQ